MLDKQPALQPGRRPLRPLTSGHCDVFDPVASDSVGTQIRELAGPKLVEPWASSEELGIAHLGLVA